MKNTDNFENNLKELIETLKIYPIGTGVTVSNLIRTFSWEGQLAFSEKESASKKALEKAGYKMAFGITDYYQDDEQEALYIKE